MLLFKNFDVKSYLYTYQTKMLTFEGTRQDHTFSLGTNYSTSVEIIVKRFNPM